MEHLVITVSGGKRPAIANELTRIAALSKCNVVDCKMATLGQEFTASMLLSGNWNAIVKMESGLEALEHEQGVQITRQRTQSLPYSKDYLPYVIYVVARDQHAMLHHITDFFVEQGMDITELYQESRPARKTGTMIMFVTLYINIPLETSIADLRERFIVFCDSYNLDGVMEGEKGM